MKKALVVLVMFILITSSVSLLSAPNVKADSSEVQILSYSWYIAPASTTQAQYIGDLIVVGEVQNTGTHTLGNIVIGGEAYNLTQGYVSSAQWPAISKYLAPGQKAPFYIDFTPEVTDTTTEIDQNWASLVTNVTLRVLIATDLTQTEHTTFDTSVTAASATTGTYTVTGSVQNTGTQASGRVWLITTFYNASGTVVGTNFTNYYISQSLLPGRSASFKVTPTDDTAPLSSSIANYSILVQEDPLPSSTPTPTAPPTTSTPSSNNSPTPSSTASPPIGISTSLLIYLVSIAVIIVIVILAILMFLRRKRNAEFDLPPPPPPT